MVGFLGSPLSWSIEVVVGPTLTMDPNGFTPLAGLLELTTDVPTRVTLTIGSDDRTWIVESPAHQREHSLPLLGLRPNITHTVEVTVIDEADPSDPESLVLSALEAITAAAGRLSGG